MLVADEFVLARGMVRRLRLRNNFPVPIQLHMASVSDPRMLLLQVPEGAVAQPYGVWPALSVVVPFAADAALAHDGQLVLVLPERDQVPAVEELAAMLRRPTTFATI